MIYMYIIHLCLPEMVNSATVRHPVRVERIVSSRGVYRMRNTVASIQTSVPNSISSAYSSRTPTTTNSVNYSRLDTLVIHRGDLITWGRGWSEEP